MTDQAAKWLLNNYVLLLVVCVTAALATIGACAIWNEVLYRIERRRHRRYRQYRR